MPKNSSTSKFVIYGKKLSKCLAKYKKIEDGYRVFV